MSRRGSVVTGFTVVLIVTECGSMDWNGNVLDGDFFYDNNTDIE